MPEDASIRAFLCNIASERLCVEEIGREFNPISSISFSSIQSCIRVAEQLLEGRSLATLKTSDSKTRSDVKSARRMLESFPLKLFAQAIDSGVYSCPLAMRDHRRELFASRAVADV
jgi:hypothetical protein